MQELTGDEADIFVYGSKCGGRRGVVLLRIIQGIMLEQVIGWDCRLAAGPGTTCLGCDGSGAMAQRTCSAMIQWIQEG